MARTENTFRNDLTDRIHMQLKDSYVQKNHGGLYSAGLTDIMVIWAGDHAHLELKALEILPIRGSSTAWAWKDEKHGVTALQASTMKRLLIAGANAAVLLYVKPLRLVWRIHAEAVLSMRKQEVVWTTESLMGQHKGHGILPGDFGHFAWSYPSEVQPNLANIVWGKAEADVGWCI